ncbi:DUF6870 family protein [Terrisporobacter petrolearius]|uniref:DUF6870 family protein n=1 Tax=Terrisporobacter petrolearius TaxID=1460447 RepID=UPI003CCFEDCD
MEEINQSSLVGITTVNIDTSLPATERMQDYLEQIKNPYCFLCNGVPVKICFHDEAGTLERRLKNCFVSLKKADSYTVLFYNRTVVSCADWRKNATH